MREREDLLEDPDLSPDRGSSQDEDERPDDAGHTVSVGEQKESSTSGVQEVLVRIISWTENRSQIILTGTL